jgi:hypothetical protein
MRLRGTKKLVVGVAAAMLVTGGAGAFAATQLASNPRQAYLNDVAKRLHVTPTALTNAMKQARIDQIDAAQKAGKLTAAQAKAAKRSIESGKSLGGFRGRGGPGPGFGAAAPPFSHGRFGCGGSSMSMKTTTTNTTTTNTTTKACPRGPVLGPHAGFVPRPGFRPHAGFAPRRGFGLGIGLGPGVIGSGESAVTSYLGITAPKLRSDLASGKSLKQITSAISGKSLSGLEAALTAAEKKQLDKAVSAGRMTSKQETKELSALSSWMSKLVNSSFKVPGNGHGHHTWGP